MRGFGEIGAGCSVPPVCSFARIDEKKSSRPHIVAGRASRPAPAMMRLDGTARSTHHVDSDHHTAAVHLDDGGPRGDRWNGSATTAPDRASQESRAQHVGLLGFRPRVRTRPATNAGRGLGRSVLIDVRTTGRVPSSGGESICRMIHHLTERWEPSERSKIDPANSPSTDHRHRPRPRRPGSSPRPRLRTLFRSICPCVHPTASSSAVCAFRNEAIHDAREDEDERHDGCSESHGGDHPRALLEVAARLLRQGHRRDPIRSATPCASCRRASSAGRCP